VTDESTSEGSGGSQHLEVFRIIDERLREAVRREEDTDYRSSKANRVTQTVGRLSMIVIALLTPPVFYLIWTLVMSMGVITERMQVMHAQVDQMEHRFDEVAVRMTTINRSVSNMSRNISVIPPLEQRMLGMRDDMGIISGSMDGIAPSVHAIDQILGGMDQNLARIDYVFGFLNRDVFRMRNDVNQMSSPMRMIPFFGQ
jgi:archaellum component FlaC